MGIIYQIFGEGKGIPVQYSCLENPMDRGAWYATVHGVLKNRTRLGDFTFTFTFMHQRRKWQPNPLFLPGESQGQQSLVGCRLWSRTELDMTAATQQQQQHTRFQSIFVHFFYNVLILSQKRKSALGNVLCTKLMFQYMHCLIRCFTFFLLCGLWDVSCPTRD